MSPKLYCTSRIKAPQQLRHVVMDYAVPMLVYGALYFSVICAMGIAIAMVFPHHG